MMLNDLCLDTSVVILGSGGVATSLARALDDTVGYSVRQIFSPHLAHAEALAGKLAVAEAIDRVEDMIPDADIVIISVTDDAVAQLVASLIPRPDTLWLHTSGSLPASILATLGPRYGVLYPLQTFSRSREVRMARVPIFIEASTDEAMVTLRRLADNLSDTVHEADSERRRRLHVAAVFACNFANHLWAIADELLTADGLSFDVLVPLLKETLEKAADDNPSDGQTGPARRGDRSVMEAHQAMLSPANAEIYRLLSQSIISRYDSL